MTVRREIIVIVTTLTILFFYLSKFYRSVQTEDDLFDKDISVEQDNPILLNYIRKNHIIKPPPSTAMRKLTKSVDTLFPMPENDPGNQHLRRLLGDKPNGFFVECGANDGEFLSNSVGLEVLKGWTGLLIEGSPTYFSKLTTKNRNAWLADTCLSGSRPEKLEFLKHKMFNEPEYRVGNGRIKPGGEYKEPPKLWGEKAAYHRHNYISEGHIDCMPLYSVLSAINVTHVDFLSLDVEGNEFNILQGIPFDRIRIEVIFVEYILAAQGKSAFIDLMTSNGYLWIYEGPTDLLFTKI